MEQMPEWVQLEDLVWRTDGRRAGLAQRCQARHLVPLSMHRSTDALLRSFVLRGVAIGTHFARLGSTPLEAWAKGCVLHTPLSRHIAVTYFVLVNMIAN